MSSLRLARGIGPSPAPARVRLCPVRNIRSLQNPDAPACCCDKHRAHMLVTAFPDQHYELQEMVAEGDRLVVRWQMTGTHLVHDQATSCGTARCSWWGQPKTPHTLSASSYAPRSPSGSTTLRLACTHFGSMEFSHGLCFGRKQLTILTPLAPCLTPRLCFPSHLLTSLEICQLALSQIRRRTFLSAAWSSSKHHERNCVVMELTGLPSTNLIHVSSSPGR